MHPLHRDTVGEGSRVKNVEAIRKTNGRVARRRADWVLTVLGAEGISQIEPGRKLLMAFVVSEGATRAKLSGCWQPRDRETATKIAIQLDGRHIQIA